MMNNLLAVTSKALGVAKTDIKNIRPVGGMTNINYEVSIGNDQYIVRLPGLGTEQFINRQEEKDNLQIGTELGINPEEIFFDTDTGLKITRLIPGSKTLTTEMTKKCEVMEAVTEIFRKLHHGKTQMENSFNLYKLMEKYEYIAEKEEVQFYLRFAQTKEEVMAIMLDYDQLSFLTAPTHIDALYQNFLQDENGKFYLIDWEYSGMFDPLWDVATHMMESAFNVAEETTFLQLYFKRAPTKEEEQRIIIHKIFQDYLWSLWTLFKEAKGDEFGSYGQDRFNRLKKNITFYEERYSQKLSM